MNTSALTTSPRFPSLLSELEWLGGLAVRVSRSLMKRQAIAALGLSALAVAVLAAAAGRADAADLSAWPDDESEVVVNACGAPEEIVVLYDENGHPTVPARTPYYYCVTNTTLLPGDIPPPPEYCCG